MQVRPLVAALPVLRVVWPGYLHLLTVGWITQLIIGVALWLFPRSDRSRPAPPPALAWGVYLTLNAGLLLRLVAEPAAALNPATPIRWLLPVSGLLQLAAACGFAALIWPRVRQR